MVEVDDQLVSVWELTMVDVINDVCELDLRRGLIINFCFGYCILLFFNQG